MSGRTVIVTGGAGTIGRAIAGAFAGQGDFVAIWDLKKDRPTRRPNTSKMKQPDRRKALRWM